MYSEKIQPKVTEMFDELRERVSEIVEDASSAKEAINNSAKIISSELAARSQSILSDMLFDLSDSVMDTEFFTDIIRQNRFFEINLRQEILSKYQFTPTSSVNYNEASKEVQALKVGGAVLATGGIIEVGVVLIAGLSLTKLIPVPISALIIASIGGALAYYYSVAPKRNKQSLARALDDYLTNTQKEFLKWFDDVENYFNKRVEEIKKMIEVES